MKNETRLKAVDTPELTAIGYNAEGMKAVLLFKATGHAWEFTRVPAEVGEAFMAAKDPQAFIQQRLMKRFHVIRLTPREVAATAAAVALRPPEPLPITPAPQPAPERKPWRRWTPCARRVSIPHEPVMPGDSGLTLTEYAEVSEMLRLADLLGELPSDWLPRLTRGQRVWLGLKARPSVRWMMPSKREISVSGRFGYWTVGD